MGKEVKIGLAVIGVLLIIFAVVVTNRLTGSTDDAAASLDGDKAASKAVEKSESPATDPKKRSSAGPSKPTIISAKATSGEIPRQSASSKSSRWAVVSDDNSASQGNNRTAGHSSSSPPSFMPKPAASQVSRYSQTGISQSSPQSNPLREQSLASEQSSRYSRQITVQRQISPYSSSPQPGYQPPAPSPSGVRGLTVSSGGSSALGHSNQYIGSAGRAEDGTCTVQPNDSYWTISQRLYGTGRYFKALARFNRGRHPEADQLRVGDSILAPTEAELRKTFADLCPSPSHGEAARNRVSTASTASGFGSGRVYVVEEGDTLFDIARHELGKAARWVEIYQLNRRLLGTDFDYLTPGLKLVLPDGRRPVENVTQQPGSAYQR